MTEENIKRMALEAGFSDGEVNYCQSIIIHLATLIVQQEREACAKICDDWPNGRDDIWEIGNAIRARGQA